MADVEALDAKAIAAILKPIRERVEAADLEIHKMEQQLAEAREGRRVLVRILRAADPSPPKPTSKRHGGSRHPGQHQEVVDRTVDWLREHADERWPDGFTQSDLRNSSNGDDGHGVERVQSAWGGYFRTMQEQGAIRIDRLNERGTAVYKLIHEKKGD